MSIKIYENMLIIINNYINLNRLYHYDERDYPPRGQATCCKYFGPGVKTRAKRAALGATILVPTSRALARPG